MSNYHITSIQIERPIESVWKWVIDPLTYPKIYPHWVSEVSVKEENKYEITTSEGYKLVNFPRREHIYRIMSQFCVTLSASI